MFPRLTPLQRFYTHKDRPVPEAQELRGEEIPEPYRRLLVHDRDMTSTLAEFHGGPIGLRILDSRREASIYHREVVLVCGEKTVEFGAIQIHLDCFAEAVQRRILEGTVPLGAILQDFDIPFVSTPRAFFESDADGVMCEALGLSEAAKLYGRQNELKTPAGEMMAEIIEILPPVVTGN